MPARLPPAEKCMGVCTQGERLPDAIVISDIPRHCQGHPGSPPRSANCASPRFEFDGFRPQTGGALMQELRVESGARTADACAGGSAAHEQVRRAVPGISAAGVRMGTATFAVISAESHTHRAQAGACHRGQPEDVGGGVCRVARPASISARGVYGSRTISGGNPCLQKQRPNCDPDHVLGLHCLTVAACVTADWPVSGNSASIITGGNQRDVSKGLFFRGAGTLPFGSAVHAGA